MRTHYSILLVAILTLTPIGFSQPEAAGSRPGAGPETTPLRAGTPIRAELEATLDSLSAKPGQEVAARVIKDTKQDGRTVIRKGDRLVGKIVQVETGLHVTVFFDRLMAGKTVTALNTVVTAVMPPDELDADDAGELHEPAVSAAPGNPSRKQGDVLGALFGPTLLSPGTHTAGRSEFTFSPDHLRLEAGTGLRFGVVDPAEKGRKP